MGSAFVPDRVSRTAARAGIWAASLLLAAAAGTGATRSAAESSHEPRVSPPVSFLANRGQIRGPVRFVVAGRDKSLFFTDTGVTFRLSGAAHGGGNSFRPASRSQSEPAATGWSVKLDFVNGRAEAEPRGEQKAGLRVSYFNGKAEDWKSSVPAFASIRYPEVWPGIDLRYKGVEGAVKYDFTLAAGADPHRIRLRYRGAERAHLLADGSLAVETPCGAIQDAAPTAYQDVDGTRKPVTAHYRLENASDGTDVTFSLGDYDPSRPLVLDPALLVYCGYIGGGLQDAATSIAVDGDGNAYVAGYTYSHQDTFPVTVGPDLTQNGNGDAFIAKVKADGSGLDYLGYIGGSGNDVATGVAVDSNGRAYVAGYTTSTQATFPVKVGPDLTFNGGGTDGTDAWVACVSADGSSLDYCGYVGGTDDDEAFAVAVDGAGSAHVVGLTLSDQLSFPVAVGPKLFISGQVEAFVAKVKPDGSGLLYCGYIGGADLDEASAAAIGPDGSLFVAGDTASDENTFPVSGGPGLHFQGQRDAWIAKVKLDGSGLTYCGYIGGAGDERAYGLAVDSNGRAFVGGATTSSQTTFPVTGGPDLTYNGGIDGWIAEVSATGTVLEYCGYLGGASDDFVAALALGPDGTPYVTGPTASLSNSFPVTNGPDRQFRGGAQDAFVAHLTAGAQLDYCGYLGGSDTEVGAGIAVDAGGAAYVCGFTSSRQDSFPVRVGPGTSLDGGASSLGDAYVAKIAPNVPAATGARLLYAPRSVNLGTVRIGRTKIGHFKIRNTGTGAAVVNIPPLPGPYTVTPLGNVTVPGHGTLQVEVQYRPQSRGSSLVGLAITSTDGNAPLTLLSVRSKAK